MAWAEVVQAVAVASLGPRAPVLDGDVAGGEVDDGTGDEEGRDLAGTTVEQVDVLTFDDVKSADAGADVDADVVAIFLGDLEAGVFHGFCGSGQGEVDETAHFASLFFVHEEEGVEVFDLGGETDGVASEIKGFDLGHAASTCQQTLPDLRGGVANPAEKTEAGYDDTTLLHFLFCRLLVLFDVVDGILDGFNLLGILVRDLDVEGFFELHDEFDDVEGVGAEIFLKACAWCDLSLVHLKLLDNNLLNLFVYCCHFVLLFTSGIKPKFCGRSHP